MASRARRSARPAGPPRRWTPVWVCAFLVVLTWLVFGETLRHDFVNYDDPSYVYANSRITEGLSSSGIVWAFTHSHARNWHPLTTLSHMLDCQVFGLRAGGHHFTNVFLHSLAVLLLFLLLRQMTGALWRSAFVTIIFAIHPLRVESVAWVAERKDVLSGVFFMLTLIAYVRYVRSRSIGRYFILLVLFAFGLMSKPMLVTLPFVLLLLDYWPLNRFAQPALDQSKARHRNQPRSPAPLALLVGEKIPLFVLAAASCLVTYLVQKSGGAQAEPLPFAWRIGNAFVAYVTYIRQMIWPAELAPLYPHPENQLPGWMIALAVALLLILTAVTIIRRRQNPYFVTGWFWYLGMLLPVIGIIQVGSQGWADRYTYLPQIGLSICLTWALADLSVRWRHRQLLLGAGGALAVAAFAWTSSTQAAYWRDSESLWTRTLAVTSGNSVAHNNLGEVLFKRGQLDEAISHYEKALEIRSQNQTSRYDFLLALTHGNLGAALRRKGLLDSAIGHYRKAVELQPDYAEGYFGLGSALTEKGQIEEAIAALQKAVTLRPEYTEAHVGLGDAFLRQRMDKEAIAEYERALEIAPQALVPLNNLAWLYATSSNDSIRNGRKAVDLAEQAVRISAGQDPLFLHKLAAAYAATENYPRAIETARRALQIATDQGNTALVHELERNISVYRTNNQLTDTRR